MLHTIQSAFVRARSGVLARRSLKPLTRLSTRGRGLQHARLHDLLRDASSKAPRLRSGYRALARTFRFALLAQETRSAELCNPRYQRRAPVLDVATTRLASASLAPSGELCASTAAKPASAGLSCRGGRTFSVRSRAHSGPASDVPSPAAFRLIPQCGRSFRAADRDRFHHGHVEWQRLSRSKTPSISKEPGRLFTLATIPFFAGRQENDHDAPSPIADSPRRARPCPPLSAATESGFLGPTPLADFCNHFTEHGHTERATIPRTKLAISALFAATVVTGAASSTAPGSPFEAARLASEDARRTGRKAPSPACARWRQRPTRRLAEHLLSPTDSARDLIAFPHCEPADRGPVPTFRANG